jgi:eukaryotic-like serine/threonine-protein kinase
MSGVAVKTSNSCASADQLSALLIDELPADQKAALEDHLAICLRCQSALLEQAGDLDLTPLSAPAIETDHGAGSGSASLDENEPRRGFLQSIPQPEMGLAAGPAAMAPFSPATDTLSLPGLELVDELGRGGIGVVYLAWQQSLCRLVAVKVVSREWLTTPEQRERVLRGAAAAVRLQHPNIVQVYHIGQQGSWVYGILEYLEGGTLAERMTGKPWEARAAAQLLCTLADAVGYVHRNGFIHRDLKPANILFKADGTPKLADFGLVRSLASDSKLTRVGEALGTPRFMAPEQAQGNKNIGPQVDIHALGVVLYEMLTGKPLFQGGTKYETIYQVVHQVVTPPEQIQPDIPASLAAICMKCLEKDPARRFPTGVELAEALRQYLAGVPEQTVAVPSSVASRAAHRSNTRLLAALLALVIVEAIGLVLVGRELSEARHAADRLNDPQPRTTREIPDDRD